MEDAEAKDLDETRRLLYMAMAAGRTDRYNLVGTLTNALIHHAGLETDANLVIERLVPIVAGHNGADLAWLRGHIARVVGLLVE